MCRKRGRWELEPGGEAIDRVTGARLVVSFGGDAASSGMRVHQAVWAGTPGTGRVPDGVEADKRLRKRVRLPY